MPEGKPIHGKFQGIIDPVLANTILMGWDTTNQAFSVKKKSKRGGPI